MNGPADRSVRLLLIVACVVIAYDTARLLSRAGIETVPVDDLTVQINLDPPERLRLLPGIGPVIARQLVEERSRRPFHDPEDLVARIRGIGPAFVANFGEWLRFDREPALVAMSRSKPLDQERLP